MKTPPLVDGSGRDREVGGAFTRLSQSVKFAGDRAELDQKIGRLFALAA